jgi:adenylylsulfate reductase subunit A
MANFETVEVTTDILIVGGGMAACGAAVEAAYWAKKNNLKVTLVDKAALDRSGAVAMGLSAINQYVGLKDGENTLEDYVRYVRNDLMGITREDLVANIARHVDASVHLFEKWGLPIWTDDEGKYVHEGRWQLMINGESYKVVVSEEKTNFMFLKPRQLWSLWEVLSMYLSPAPVVKDLVVPGIHHGTQAQVPILHFRPVRK